jgi:hypothetical protein
VPDLPGVRLRTSAGVIAYAAAHGVELRIDGTETQVRRPRANRPGRRAFVSGKRGQNTIKTTTISDGRGRTLWAGAVRPGRMHDQTAVKTGGIKELFRQYPSVTARVEQPALKTRGRENLRIIYGPEYTQPENLDRLRDRGLGRKRSLALREFALGIEALERFVRGEPLRRVHECVFGVLALESEPVDPRL